MPTRLTVRLFPERKGLGFRIENLLVTQPDREVILSLSIVLKGRSCEHGGLAGIVEETKASIRQISKCRLY